ncbi:SH3 domain-containing protein [Devosia sp.]|jgi:uncharacterized protein YraI|uniref:SH3 domain-containing protein n=1 Tax=Devosia sp. TaxID=1871048 RepID=UPI0037BEB707
MINRIVTAATVAVFALAATAGAASAAQYAWVDQNAKVKAKPFNVAATVNTVFEGQKVKIIAENGNWVKIKIPGMDGWVKSGVLDYAPFPNNNPWPNNGNGQVCFNGQYGYICIGN